MRWAIRDGEVPQVRRCRLNTFVKARVIADCLDVGELRFEYLAPSMGPLDERVSMPQESLARAS